MWVTVVYSFSWLYGIPLHDYSTLILFLMDDWIVFSFFFFYYKQPCNEQSCKCLLM